MKECMSFEKISYISSITRRRGVFFVSQISNHYVMLHNWGRLEFLGKEYTTCIEKSSSDPILQKWYPSPMEKASGKWTVGLAANFQWNSIGFSNFWWNFHRCFFRRKFRWKFQISMKFPKIPTEFHRNFCQKLEGFFKKNSEYAITLQKRASLDTKLDTKFSFRFCIQFRNEI